MKRSKSFGPRLCSVRLLQGFVLLMREVSEGLKFGYGDLWEVILLEVGSTSVNCFYRLSVGWMLKVVN